MFEFFERLAIVLAVIAGLVCIIAIAAVLAMGAITVAHDTLFCEVDCVFSDEDEYYR